MRELHFWLLFCDEFVLFHDPPMLGSVMLRVADTHGWGLPFL